MPTIEDIQEQIKRLDGTSKLLGFREIGELPNILWEDEKVEGIVQGRYCDRQGILVATNKRLVFLDKGLLWGLRVEDFAYSKITSIQCNMGLIFGKINIFAAGNKAEIDQISKQQAKMFVENVRARITGVKAHASYTEKIPANVDKIGQDILTQLERLADLRNQDMLTEEEFVLAKKKIIGK